MKFEIGEVVMIYDRESVRYVKIKTVFPDGTLTVRNYSKKEKVEFGIEYPAHPKQCRKLKPKKKRRVIWLHTSEINARTIGYEPVESMKNLYIKFREVRDK